MKCTLLVFLAILAIVAAQEITTWGDVVNTSKIYEEHVAVPYRFLRKQKRIVTYTMVDERLIVRGVVHIDYQQTRSNASLGVGAIDTRSVSVVIESQRGYGINSTVQFYF